MITTKGLTFNYPEGGGRFSFPDIALGKEKHLLILGPSGIGKTTLLHLLSGILPPLNGKIYINNTDVCSLDRKALDLFRGQNIGIIFQHYHYIKSLTIEENLILRQRLPRRLIDKERRLSMLSRLGLTKALTKKGYQLSQGQKQRLAIALGLIHQPKLVLADEPTSNLDDQNCDAVISLLKEEAKLCGSSLVIITHDQRVKSHFNHQIVL